MSAVFVGHGLLAFAIVALAAERLGWSRETALRLGVVAALFGTLPDVDIVYALTGLVGIEPTTTALVDSFWSTGNQVHRGVTHSLVVGLVTAAGVALAARPSRSAQSAGNAVIWGLVAVVFVISGPLAAVIAAAFAAGAAALVVVAVRADLPPAGVGAAALVGLCLHPFGDLFTGAPPDVLYPFDVTVFADRVLLASDPTLHLLAAFGVELTIVWAALAVYFHLTGRRLRDHVDYRAVPGVGYAGAAVAIPSPTVDVAYQFVFSVLAVGALGLAPPPRDRIRSWRGATTALAAVTLAAIAYAVGYLYLFG